MNKRLRIAAAVLAVTGTVVAVPMTADAKGKPDRTIPSVTVLGSYCSQLQEWTYQSTATDRFCAVAVNGKQANPTFSLMGQVETYCESFPGWTLKPLRGGGTYPDNDLETGLVSWNCRKV